MQVQRYQISVTTNSSGDATAYTTDLQSATVGITGRVLSITIATNNLTAGAADYTFTVESTGEAILTRTNQTGTGTYYPRVAVHDSTGAATTYDGTHGVLEPVAMFNDRVKLVVAQGGNVLTALIYVVVG